MDYGGRFKVIFNRRGRGGFSQRTFQNRERTGVPKRAARLGWWMRPDHKDNLEKDRRRTLSWFSQGTQ